jgi:hypothetical protein
MRGWRRLPIADPVAAQPGHFTTQTDLNLPDYDQVFIRSVEE